MEFDKDTYILIEDYITDKLSETDRKAFELRLQSDEQLKKEVDIHLTLKHAVTEQGWHSSIDYQKNHQEIKELSAYRRSDEFTAIQNKLQKVSSQYFDNTTPSRHKKRNYYLISAVAILLILVSIQFLPTSSNSLYNDYNDWKNLPSLTTQSNTEKLLSQGEQYFLNQEYELAIPIFSEYIQKQQQSNQSLHPYVLSYLGAAYTESGNYTKALATFKLLQNENAIDASRKYWYTAMVYLKQGDKEKAKEELQFLIKDQEHFNYQKAKELLELLD